MKIVFAQGNPEQRYANTRHNTGFLVVDALANKERLKWRDIDKYKARVAEFSSHGEKIMLVKPLSFYNDTGLVARQLIDYYKLEPSTDFVVIHDDLALPLGTVRTRQSGSDAGNNGIKSLNAHIGALYPRIRVGIWTEQRDLMDDVHYVLGSFSKTERAKLDGDIIPHTLELIDIFVAGKLPISSTSL